MGMFECSAVGCSDEVPGEGNELTVVVEYETDLEGGAYEVGVAPEGSPGLERLVSEARGEADAMVGNEGGWAAVRIGFGDVESIDCESGRTVYIAGGELVDSSGGGRANGTPTPVFRGCLALSPHPCAPRGCCPLEPCLRKLEGA